MPNFSSLVRLEVPEKFVWGGGWGGVGCKVISVSNPTYIELSLSFRCVVVLTTAFQEL